MTSTLHQTMKATAEGLLRSFVTASRSKNMKDLSAQCTDNCRRYIGPASYMKLAGVPLDFSMSNSEYEAQFGTMEFYTLDECEVTHLVVDTEDLKVAAKAEIKGAFRGGEKISRTHVWFMDFTPDGTKVSKVYQHVDFAEGEAFRALLAKYKKDEEKKGAQNGVKDKEQSEQSA